MKRITLITGHFGSGKTEVSVNMTVDLKEQYDKVAIVDLDIANPYFRSRERQRMLEDLGINVEFNQFGYDITEDLPALSATIKAPLENDEYMTIVDVGGDDSGARVLNQFRKYFIGDDSEMLCVINGNRPETTNKEGCIDHIRRIEAETGLKMDGIINNTHMMKETTTDDILEGYRLCSEVSLELGIPIRFTTCHPQHAKELATRGKELGITEDAIYPLKRLYMRPSWLS